MLGCLEIWLQARKPGQARRNFPFGEQRQERQPQTTMFGGLLRKRGPEHLNLPVIFLTLVAAGRKVGVHRDVGD